MILSDAQWRDIKAVRWDKKESRRIQQRIHDDKLMVGWCPRRERWVIARLVDATVMVQFGVRTIPTSERAPYVWKRWEDDDGTPLDIRDPRLITYIQRCDLWRQDLSKYMAKFDHDDWVQDEDEMRRPAFSLTISFGEKQKRDARKGAIEDLLKMYRSKLNLPKPKAK